MVQLPQTIDALNQGLMAQLDQRIRSLPHGMLTFLGRAAESVKYAQKHYPNIVALPAPDIAWSLGPLMAAAQQVDVLMLLRSDKEAAAREAAVTKNLRATSQQYSALLQRNGISCTVRDWDFTAKAGLSFQRETSQVNSTCCRPWPRSIPTKVAALLMCLLFLLCAGCTHSVGRLTVACGCEGAISGQGGDHQQAACSHHCQLAGAAPDLD